MRVWGINLGKGASVNFSFEEETIDGNRVVVLVIPAAEEIPTAFKEKRYIRIGSSKAALKDYPKREIQLFKILCDRGTVLLSRVW